MSSKRHAPKDALSVAWDKNATVFVGRLPRRSDVSDIYSFASQVAPLRQVIPSRDTYCFIEFMDAEGCSVAVNLLNGQPFGGSRVVIQPAINLTKLFVGNIDKTLDAKTIHDAISAAEPGLVSVELFELSGVEARAAEAAATRNGGHGGPSTEALFGSSTYGSAASAASTSGLGASIVYSGGEWPANAAQQTAGQPNKLLHRGFCFAEFRDHASAHRGLQLMLQPGFRIGNSTTGGPGDHEHVAASESQIIGYNNHGYPIYSDSYDTEGYGAASGGLHLRVDWAEPLHEVAAAVMEHVKILYVSNLPPSYADATEESLAQLFSSVTDSGAGVERVKRIKNFAFVHFRTRREAEQGLAALNNHVIAGHAIKVQWSKPPPGPRPGAGVGGIQGLGQIGGQGYGAGASYIGQHGGGGGGGHGNARHGGRSGGQQHQHRNSGPGGNGYQHPPPPPPPQHDSSNGAGASAQNASEAAYQQGLADGLAAMHLLHGRATTDAVLATTATKQPLAIVTSAAAAAQAVPASDADAAAGGPVTSALAAADPLSSSSSSSRPPAAATTATEPPSSVSSSTSDSPASFALGGGHRHTSDPMSISSPTSVAGPSSSASAAVASAAGVRAEGGGAAAAADAVDAGSAAGDASSGSLEVNTALPRPLRYERSASAESAESATYTPGSSASAYDGAVAVANDSASHAAAGPAGSPRKPASPSSSSSLFSGAAPFVPASLQQQLPSSPSVSGYNAASAASVLSQLHVPGVTPLQGRGNRALSAISVTSIGGASSVSAAGGITGISGLDSSSHGTGTPGRSGSVVSGTGSASGALQQQHPTMIVTATRVVSTPREGPASAPAPPSPMLTAGGSPSLQPSASIAGAHTAGLGAGGLVASPRHHSQSFSGSPSQHSQPQAWATAGQASYNNEQQPQQQPPAPWATAGQASYNNEQQPQQQPPAPSGGGRGQQQSFQRQQGSAYAGYSGSSSSSGPSTPSHHGQLTHMDSSSTYASSSEFGGGGQAPGRAQLPSLAVQVALPHPNAPPPGARTLLGLNRGRGRGGGSSNSSNSPQNRGMHGQHHQQHPGGAQAGGYGNVGPAQPPPLPYGGGGGGAYAQGYGGAAAHLQQQQYQQPGGYGDVVDQYGNVSGGVSPGFGDQQYGGFGPAPAPGGAFIGQGAGVQGGAAATPGGRGGGRRGGGGSGQGGSPAYGHERMRHSFNHAHNQHGGGGGSQSHHNHHQHMTAHAAAQAAHVPSAPQQFFGPGRRPPAPAVDGQQQQQQQQGGLANEQRGPSAAPTSAAASSALHQPYGGQQQGHDGYSTTNAAYGGKAYQQQQQQQQHQAPQYGDGSGYQSSAPPPQYQQMPYNDGTGYGHTSPPQSQTMTFTMQPQAMGMTMQQQQQQAQLQQMSAMYGYAPQQHQQQHPTAGAAGAAGERSLMVAAGGLGNGLHSDSFNDISALTDINKLAALWPLAPL